MALFRRGNESAFEELFDRHSRGVLSFCTRLLLSREEGEDALQQTFLAVSQAIGERDFEPRAFKPWLYTIARNHCFSVLRSRRQAALPGDGDAVAEAGQTDERAEQQAEVRELLSDVRGLPEPQRVALLLSELGDLSHTEIAHVIACPREKVKSLLFQARTSLCVSREARETPCSRVREELAGTLGSRLPLAMRRHVKRCEGCSEFATEVRRRRRLIAIALPVAPSIGLKRNALAMVGAGGAAGGGGLGTGLSAPGLPVSGASAGAAGGPLSAALVAKAGLVVAATAGVAAVSLVGTGVLQAPPPDQDSRDRPTASEAKSGAAERRTSVVDAALSPPDDLALAAGRHEQEPGRSSDARPRPAHRPPTAGPGFSARERGGHAAPRARGAPRPDLGVGTPVPDLGVGAPLLNSLTGVPLLDLALGGPMAGLGGSQPGPDLGSTKPGPDVGLPRPIPDPGETPPVPDIGVEEPLPDRGMTER